MGRKALPPKERRSYNMTFRMRPAMRAKLAEIANETGRSVSEEIETRLERSLAPPNSLHEALDADGPGRSALQSIVATVDFFRQRLSSAKKGDPMFFPHYERGLLRNSLHAQIDYFFGMIRGEELDAFDAERGQWAGLADAAMVIRTERAFRAYAAGKEPRPGPLGLAKWTIKPAPPPGPLPEDDGTFESHIKRLAWRATQHGLHRTEEDVRRMPLDELDLLKDWLDRLDAEAKA
jgi:hypothetical protein